MAIISVLTSFRRLCGITEKAGTSVSAAGNIRKRGGLNDSGGDVGKTRTLEKLQRWKVAEENRENYVI